MATRLEALGGTSDLLPAETARWQHVEQTARQVLARYGFQEVRTPILEYAEVFRQSLGEATEVVQKQMYQFQDRGGREVALRPEGTASAVRCYLEHGLDKTSGLVKWYYLGPMFRAERPQAGRRRQFHQLGVEVFGSASPYQDAEVMALLLRLLEAWGIKVAKFQGDDGAVLQWNNLGCRENGDRDKMLEALKEYFLEHVHDLCVDCQRRIETNPLRILDCKQDKCRSIARDGRIAPSKWLCPECQSHGDKVREALKDLGEYPEENYQLVRGLDYYTRTAFEVIYVGREGLGAQNALGGGGRYDNLVEQMGGPSTPAIGFAIGLERALMALDVERENKTLESKNQRRTVRVYVAMLGESAKPRGFKLLQDLRQNDIPVLSDYRDRPLKRQLEFASVARCTHMLLLGEDELRKGVVTVRDLDSRSQDEVALSDCVSTMRHLSFPESA